MAERTVYNFQDEDQSDEDYLTGRSGRQHENRQRRAWPDSYAHVWKRQEALRQVTEIGPVLYAVRVFDMIKIGYTSSFPTRMKAYAPMSAELLGFKFGTREDEKQIHRVLRNVRSSGREWYYPVPEVLEIVNEWRVALRQDPLEDKDLIYHQ